MYQGRTLVVFFCLHRSGSSFTARLFQRLGTSLGPFALGEAHASNPYGHFEAAPFVSLNRDLQRQAFGFADDFPSDAAMLGRFRECQGEWPSEITISDAQRQEARQLLHTLIDSGPVSGFKDPRTLLTWPFWQSVLQEFPGLRVVPLFLVRSPHEIAMSLFKRAQGDRGYGDALDVAAVHFQRMKCVREQWQGDHAVLQFEPQLLAQQLPAVAELCGLPWNPAIFFDVYDSTCRHHTAARIEHESQLLYEQMSEHHVCLSEQENLRQLLTDAALREQTYCDRVVDKQRELHEAGRQIADLSAQLATWDAYAQSREWAVFQAIVRLRAMLVPKQSRREAAAKTALRLARAVYGQARGSIAWLRAGGPATRSGWLKFRHVVAPPGSVRERVGRRIRRLILGARGPAMANVPAFEAAHFPVQPGAKYDVFCLPVIEWDFRFQRPQQLMRQFARNGHRVFYVSHRFTKGKVPQWRELEKNILEISLCGDAGSSIYTHVPTEEEVRHALASIDHLRRSAGVDAAITMVQFPGWRALAEQMRSRYGWQIVYDCMDDHAGFSNNTAAMVGEEERLLENADVTFASSTILYERASAKSSRVTLVRNAADYEHFAQALQPAISCSTGVPPVYSFTGETPVVQFTGETRANSFTGETPVVQIAAATGQRVVGYYGAIADWFDVDLMAELAQLRPDWHFQLIGHVHHGDISALERLANVELLGERPYGDLPRLIAHWDCGLIPFKRLPLTEATNPVKVYEMLAAGMPVVAVDLPELRPIAAEELIEIAADAAGFAAMIEKVCSERSAEKTEARRAFARQNTWSQRFAAIETACQAAHPLASIVVLLHNNLALNRLCIDSIFNRTEWPNFELVLVDNASTDGTRDFAREVAGKHENVKLVLNERNESFARANNLGVAASHGEYLVLLNNDTIVTRGWLTRLIGHLRRDPTIGMVGPVTNSIGNEAKIEVPYTAIEDMEPFAAWYCRRHEGAVFNIKVLALFCTAMRRDVFEQVGKLDETFEVGMFEDDDLAMRVQQAGHRIVCAEDVFIHHFHGATFKLLGTDVHRRTFENNRRKYEKKWGEWEPHQYRRRAA